MRLAAAVAGFGEELGLTYSFVCAGQCNTIPHPHPDLAQSGIMHPWTRGAIMHTQTGLVRAFERSGLAAGTATPVAAAQAAPDALSAAPSAATVRSATDADNAPLACPHRLRRTLIQYSSVPIPLHVVWRADEERLVVGPFRYVVPKQIAIFAKLPDEALLRHCSTRYLPLPLTHHHQTFL